MLIEPAAHVPALYLQQTSKYLAVADVVPLLLHTFRVWCGIVVKHRCAFAALSLADPD